MVLKLFQSGGGFGSFKLVCLIYIILEILRQLKLYQLNSGFSAWTNMKISNELEERKRADDIQFMQAGRGAVKKTYKYDPTQARPNPSAISAKKKDI